MHEWNDEPERLENGISVRGRAILPNANAIIDLATRPPGGELPFVTHAQWMKLANDMNIQDPARQMVLNALLYSAVMEGDAAAVKQAIAMDADVNARDSERNTPLMKATEQNMPDVMIVLLNAKAEVNAANKAGQTALFKATPTALKTAAQILLVAGADLEAGDVNRRVYQTPHAKYLKDVKSGVEPWPTLGTLADKQIALQAEAIHTPLRVISAAEAALDTARVKKSDDRSRD